MVRRLVTLVQGPPAALRPIDPAMEANAYAVAEDVDLTVVLRHDGATYAVAAAETMPRLLAGIGLPAGAGSQDLRGLLESGVRVVVDAAALADRGIPRAALVDGVEIADDDELSAIIRQAQGVLAW